MVGQFENQGDLNIPRLLETIRPELADLISGLALSEDGLEGDDLSLAVTDYIKALKSRSLKRREEELSKRIKEAEKAADVTSLKRLLIEKNQLLRSKSL